MSSQRLLHSRVAAAVNETIRCRRKPSVHVSKTCKVDTFVPYSKKYENGISCPLNTADIHRLTHSMNADIMECITSTPEYCIGIGSFDYNDNLLELRVIYRPAGLLVIPASISMSTVPSIYP
jgi:hypothetical protein